MGDDRAVGWYDDPQDSRGRRFWDGSSWLLPDGSSGRLVQLGDGAWVAVRFVVDNQFGMLISGYANYTAWFWSEVPAAERATAAAAHLSMLPVLRALRLRRRGISGFVHCHATEAANFQITACIAAVTTTALAVILLLVIPVDQRLWALLPIGAFYAVALLSLTWMSQAMLSALKGGSWRYPICLRLLKSDA